MKKTEDITAQVKSLDDAIALLGENDADVKDYKSLISLFNLTHHLVAQQAIIIITKALNEGWVADWNNYDEWKYFSWFYMGGSRGFRCDDYVRWSSVSGVGSRLCFKSRELAVYAGNQFTDLYKQFMLI